ncbi:hypothetical protein M3O96_05655 [Aquiflexum sp. TKW24L]|uniref:hypothetical protein n=1 Tax=Aquiflexum sp. TKW24L TaxID=2942212 RepID=UPI0020BE6631|nr:hypothetical protein [Aquiflexum sp. TKW24L]MCL6258563.1 hypothetical protein [Aquiflexum sp. TKW24L]
MQHIFNNEIGLIHFIASVLALGLGSAVLLMTKGSKTHIRMGYLYVASMAVLLVTAFMLYNLFGKWGIFHYFAVVSSLTLALGMIPIFLRNQIKNWAYLHFSFMYWSVMGLYGAFVSEMMTRIPETPLYNMVAVATGGVMVIGGIVFGFYKPKWMKIMGTIPKLKKSKGEFA